MIITVSTCSPCYNIIFSTILTLPDWPSHPRFKKNIVKSRINLHKNVRIEFYHLFHVIRCYWNWIFCTEVEVVFYYFNFFLLIDCICKASISYLQMTWMFLFTTVLMLWKDVCDYEIVYKNSIWKVLNFYNLIIFILNCFHWKSKWIEVYSFFLL